MSDAYTYYNAPSNSIGTKTIKIIKPSYFWSLIRNNTIWQMEGWNPNTNSWQDNFQGTNLNNWLTKTLTPSEDLTSEKIKLSFTSPYTTKYRFKLAFNLRVKKFVEKINNYMYLLTIPATDTEDYEIFFDWSDVSNLISSGTLSVTHGIKEINGNNYFWFILTGNSNLKSGNTFILDPTFGNVGGAGTSNAVIEDAICAGYFQMGKWKGIANTIVARVRKLLSGRYTYTIRCAIYNSNKTLLAQTEEKTISDSGIQLITLRFTEKVILEPNAWYYITIWGDNDDSTDAISVMYSTTGGNGIFYNTGINYTGTYPDPGTLTTLDSDALVDIYCTYDEPFIKSLNDGNISFSGDGNLVFEVK